MAQFLPNFAQFDNGAGFSFFVQGDFNGDGKTDIIGIRVGELVVLPGNGTGGFGAPLNTTITGLNNVQLNQFIVGDFNNDGRLDVALFGTDALTGTSVVASLLGKGNGTFDAPRETVALGVIPPYFPNSVTAIGGDFNGDAKLDIAYVTGSQICVLLGNGDGTFSSAVTTASNGLTLAAGDFNHDGKLDLAIVTGQRHRGCSRLCAPG